MSFQGGADGYDRFMGRYSSRLAPLFADFARPAGDVLDVGCGPGALTGELVSRLGADHVTAVDPTEPFVEAVRARFPGVDVQAAAAESLPFDDDAFDAALAQLVVHFMADPVGGVREMARVARAGGVVAACVWEHGRMPLSPFWEAVWALGGPDDEARRPGTREGDLARIFRDAGLAATDETSLEVHVEHETFEEWWGPFTLGVGPAGEYLAGLAEQDREAVRARCAADLGDGPLTLTFRAWAARGTPSA